MLLEPAKHLFHTPLIRLIKDGLIKERIAGQPFSGRSLQAKSRLILAGRVALVDLCDRFLRLADVFQTAIPSLLDEQVAPVDELEMEQAMRVAIDLVLTTGQVCGHTRRVDELRGVGALAVVAEDERLGVPRPHGAVETILRHAAPELNPRQDKLVARREREDLPAQEFAVGAIRGESLVRVDDGKMCSADLAARAKQRVAVARLVAMPGGFVDDALDTALGSDGLHDGYGVVVRTVVEIHDGIHDAGERTEAEGNLRALIPRGHERDDFGAGLGDFEIEVGQWSNIQTEDALRRCLR